MPQVTLTFDQPSKVVLIYSPKNQTIGSVSGRLGHLGVLIAGSDKRDAVLALRERGYEVVEDVEYGEQSRKCTLELKKA